MIPFLLIAALGLIAVISWALVLVFGLGGGQPIWDWAKGKSPGTLAPQILLAVAIGLIPVGVTLVASWAVSYGYRERPNRYFWPAAQLFWSLLAVGLVIVARTRHAWLDTIGLSATDWWFAFAVVAFAMVTAGLRIRAQRRAA